MVSAPRLVLSMRTRRTKVANGRWCRSSVYRQFQWAYAGAAIAARVAAQAADELPDQV